MAAEKMTTNTSFAIEVKKGVDKNGNTLYSKKSFSDVKQGAELQNIYDVASAIKAILASESRNVYVTETSNVMDMPQ